MDRPDVHRGDTSNLYVNGEMIDHYGGNAAEEVASVYKFCLYLKNKEEYAVLKRADIRQYHYSA
ncbi:hypothetical protein SAE01_35980 [Segetibacter aerophilus]|uniref:Uncharacterized protein n=1 Tax=Segetibacter aerophilus TaxID=670293 RepID=A0A512BGK7_9BACT|nr:hypothetical protein SAE01_35980 [Segetibacter aerophilus]